LITLKTKILGSYSIELNAVNGQLIYRAMVQEPIHHIDISSFQKGLYFITIKSEDYTRIEKIVKY
jgi:hypothetical protein